MKKIIFGYLSGLHQLLRKVDDTELYVILIIMLIEFILLFFFIIIFDVKTLSIDSFLPNKWLSRFTLGTFHYLFNKYILGLREGNYLKYDPMPKKLTLITTIGFFSFFILLIIFKNSIPVIK